MRFKTNITKYVLKIKRRIRRFLLRISPVSLKNKLFDLFYKIKYDAIANRQKVILIKTKNIKKLIENEKMKKLTFGNIMDGDWDLKVRSVYGSKYQSIVQHFEKGVAWEHTILFDNYRKRLKKEKEVLGCRNIEELKKRYQVKIHRLFTNIQENGFQLPSKETSYMFTSIGMESFYTVIMVITD